MRVCWKHGVIGVVLLTALVSGCATPTKSPSTNKTVTKGGEGTSPSIDVFQLKPVGTPTNAEKRAVFDRVWNLFHQHYPSFAFKVVNWSQEKSVYEPQALNATTWDQLFEVLNRMIFTLHDFHSGLVHAPSKPLYTPFVLTKYVDNQLVVAASNGTKIRPGMIILGTNGISINNFMDNIGVDSHQVPDFFRPIGPEILDALLETSNKPETLTLYNPQNGNVLSTSLPVYKNNYKLFQQFAQRHPSVVNQLFTKSTFSIRNLGNGILYIKVSRMANHLRQDFQDNLTKLTKAKGIIIDLRGNGGGNSAPGSWLAQHFYVSPTTALDYRYAPNVKWSPSTLPPLSPHISAPTAVLINGGTGSSAEMFVAQLAAAPNVETFGSRTMGIDGHPKVFPVMDGVQVKISSWQERVTNTGLPIEQFGIAPENVVHETYQDFRKELNLLYKNEDGSHYDDVLQSALRWLKSKTHPVGRK